MASRRDHSNILDMEKMWNKAIDEISYTNDVNIPNELDIVINNIHMCNTAYAIARLEKLRDFLRNRERIKQDEDNDLCITTSTS